ncbi:hypothetical protein PBT90_04840 [Algoriphagus halophytocola]|uniref:Outer membrane protein beta-barrel domain-containing protein n=1 Tax=Algoriphagus halophytocola TaxID=2991499 RepID=A0ABY6MG08_9BACT|nr:MULTISPECIES: hypothetical protein [unclassified Algoriphagus]UZD22745.1 hypothetical protein OM944_19100 [Algoriphagus sp. TR-M5]WBL44010.1 hypothetical protein PBT90_04840 [Algoriphagus sp. TR-M9]
MTIKILQHFILLTLFLGSSSFAQEAKNLTYYIGAGPAIDGNIGLYGIHVSNELSYSLGKRTTLNPSLTYYQSIKSFDNFDDPNFGQDNSSGLFTSATLKYDVLKTKKDFRISLAFGPSFQIGSENSTDGAYLRQDELGTYYEYLYSIERFARLGYTQQVVFDWKSKNENRRNSALVSMSSFGGYWPWYLMATYRMGFKLK